MISINTKLLIPFFALLFILNAIFVLAAEDDSNDKPDDDKRFLCYRDDDGSLMCWCYQGDGTCANLIEKCESLLACETENNPGSLGKTCECVVDEDKLRETGSQFDELKSKIGPHSPAVENAPTDPVVHDHRSPKIDNNSSNQENVIAPSNRTGTVRVKRTRPSTSPTENAPAPIVTDHR